MNLEKAIDRNVELKGELVREGRLEKAEGVQLGIEAIKRLQQYRFVRPNGFDKPLPGETKD